MRHFVSTLDSIAEQVFKAQSVEDAKKICLEYLKESRIKEVDRLKMIHEIGSMKSLNRLQLYIANALLKFEGLGVSTRSKTEKDV